MNFRGKLHKTKEQVEQAQEKNTQKRPYEQPEFQLSLHCSLFVLDEPNYEICLCMRCDDYQSLVRIVKDLIDKMKDHFKFWEFTRTVATVLAMLNKYETDMSKRLKDCREIIDSMIVILNEYEDKKIIIDFTAFTDLIASSYKAGNYSEAYNYFLLCSSICHNRWYAMSEESRYKKSFASMQVLLVKLIVGMVELRELKKGNGTPSILTQDQMFPFYCSMGHITFKDGWIDKAKCVRIVNSVEELKSILDDKRNDFIGQYLQVLQGISGGINVDEITSEIIMEKLTPYLSVLLQIFLCSHISQHDKLIVLEENVRYLSDVRAFYAYKYTEEWKKSLNKSSGIYSKIEKASKVEAGTILKAECRIEYVAWEKRKTDLQTEIGVMKQMLLLVLLLGLLGKIENHGQAIETVRAILIRTDNIQYEEEEKPYEDIPFGQHGLNVTEEGRFISDFVQLQYSTFACGVASKIALVLPKNTLLTLFKKDLEHESTQFSCYYVLLGLLLPSNGLIERIQAIELYLQKMMKCKRFQQHIEEGKQDVADLIITVDRTQIREHILNLIKNKVKRNSLDICESFAMAAEFLRSCNSLQDTGPSTEGDPSNLVSIELNFYETIASSALVATLSENEKTILNLLLTAIEKNHEIAEYILHNPPVKMNTFYCLACLACAICGCPRSPADFRSLEKTSKVLIKSGLVDKCYIWMISKLYRDGLTNHIYPGLTAELKDMFKTLPTFFDKIGVFLQYFDVLSAQTMPDEYEKIKSSLDESNGYMRILRTLLPTCNEVVIKELAILTSNTTDKVLNWHVFLTKKLEKQYPNFIQLLGLLVVLIFLRREHINSMQINSIHCNIYKRNLKTYIAKVKHLILKKFEKDSVIFQYVHREKIQNLIKDPNSWESFFATIDANIDSHQRVELNLATKICVICELESMLKTSQGLIVYAKCDDYLNYEDLVDEEHHSYRESSALIKSREKQPKNTVLIPFKTSLDACYDNHVDLKDECNRFDEESSDITQSIDSFDILEPMRSSAEVGPGFGPRQKSSMFIDENRCPTGILINIDD
ncbi:hypothetical protein Ciccas_007139 [Cichlidogyrus casuarinus]|uniref:Uncharacterized protein n=1 Tax=Cichlidogyrus casuarinus TaxID=1844966 RepID=A0ABD2Q6A6_9PLAT